MTSSTTWILTSYLQNRSAAAPRANLGKRLLSPVRPRKLQISHNASNKTYNCEQQNVLGLNMEGRAILGN